MEAFAHDRTILSAPGTHPALFSDHGVVHARDVAAGALELEDVVNGRLLPARPADRREFVTALAVLIAYIHDVGMNDATREGRRAHADLCGADAVLGCDGRRADPALGERRPGRLADPLDRSRRPFPSPGRRRAPGARLARARPQQVDRARDAPCRFRSLPERAAASRARRARGSPACRSAPESGRRPAGHARREWTLVCGPRRRRVRVAGLARTPRTGR